MKTLLMVAFHFPPLAGSSGIQRTLRFVQHLPASGWQPIVLTAHARAYERTSDDLMAEIPASTPVSRAFALDAARQLSIAGRYPGPLARPDRWMSWRYDAVRRGMHLVRAHRPHAIWSTYPIATAHLIGSAIAHRSGLPWIADFRDPMAQEGYPADPRTRASFIRIETEAAKSAALLIFSTPGALREYQRRYPAAAGRMKLVENGYDEASFAEVERSPDRGNPLNPGRVTLLHSGIVYPEERDPEPLFKAVRSLIDAGTLASGSLRLRFRAPVHDALLLGLAARYGIEEVVEVLPSLPYREALNEMLRAEALLIMQSNGCNDQIPAKLYEYFRAGRPIVCLADDASDTALACKTVGIGAIAALEDPDAIATCLVSSIETLRRGDAVRAEPLAVSNSSREARCREFASLLDEAIGRAS